MFTCFGKKLRNQHFHAYKVSSNDSILFSVRFKLLKSRIAREFKTKFLDVCRWAVGVVSVCVSVRDVIFPC